MGASSAPNNEQAAQSLWIFVVLHYHNLGFTVKASVKDRGFQIYFYAPLVPKWVV